MASDFSSVRAVTDITERLNKSLMEGSPVDIVLAVHRASRELKELAASLLSPMNKDQLIQVIDRI